MLARCNGRPHSLILRIHRHTHDGISLPVWLLNITQCEREEDEQRT